MFVDMLHPQECATATVSVGTITPVALGYQTIEARWRAKGGEPNANLSRDIKSNCLGIPGAKNLWFHCIVSVYMDNTVHNHLSFSYLISLNFTNVSAGDAA